MVPQILRRREMAHLFQWYYPEGGWGWIILLCAFLSQTLAQGLQVRFDKILYLIYKQKMMYVHIKVIYPKQVL